MAGTLARCLKAEGISTLFLVPGGPIMPMVDALFAVSGLRVVMARHEAGAAFMADGYQRMTGGIAVCVVTAGPGATNAVTAIACAFREGIPVLIISGQPGLSAFGREPAQDSSPLGVDTVALFSGITKHSVQLGDPARAAETLQAAIRCALAGRPGPVHVAAPADLLLRPVTGRIRPPSRYRAGGDTVELSAVERAADLLLACRRPVILAGSGVRSACASDELRAVAARLGAPVATSPRAKGVLPENDPLSLQVFGFAGSPLADRLILDAETDCLLVVGSRLGELSSHAWDARLARKRIIQVDIDATEIARWHPVEVGIVGDARAVLGQLSRSLKMRYLRRPWWPPRSLVQPVRGVMTPDRCVGHGRLDEDTVPLRPQRVFGELGRILPPEAVLFSDIGTCMAFALHYLVIRNWNGFHANLSFASMGHAVAAVVGAKLGNPRAPAICVCGDGAFLMTGAEVHTAVENQVPCTWIVLNNGGQGSVRIGARRQFGTQGRRRGMQRMTQFAHPVDCAGMAEAMGALAFRVHEASALGPTLREAIGSGVPAVVDVRVDIDQEPPQGMRLKLLDKFFNRKE